MNRFDRKRWVLVVGIFVITCIAYAGGMLTMKHFGSDDHVESVQVKEPMRVAASSAFDPDIPKRRNAIAKIERSGKLDSALAACLQMYEECKSNLGDESSDTQDAADQYAWLLMKSGDFERAEALAKNVYQAAKTSTPNDLDVMRTRMSTLAGIMIAEGKTDEAAAIYGNRALPADWGITETFQGKFSANDRKAHFLVFWEAWCPHCAKAMPQLEQVSKNYADRGIDFIGLTQETQGMKDDDVKRFIQDHGITFTIVKEDGKTASHFGCRAVPAFRLIQGGRLIWEGYALSTERVSTRMLDGLARALLKSSGA